MPNAIWQWLDEFPEQFKQAAHLAASWDLKTLKPASEIAFLGIGGSAIGADLICGLCRERLARPVVVVRGDKPPTWLSSTSLVVAVSYSGDTHETLTALHGALELGANAIGISSGGELLKLAKARKFPHLQIPSDMAPRAALGFTSLPLIRILEAAGVFSNSGSYLSGDEFGSALKLLQMLRVEWGDDTGPGIGLARRLLSKTVIIGAAGLAAPVARRFQAQLAENAKALAIPFEFPEALHNLIETLDVHYLDLMRPIAVFLEDLGAENAERRRLAQARETFQQCGIEVIPILSQGETPLARMFSLIHKTDWVSYHLAMLKGVDPVSIPIITATKQALSAENE